MNILVDIAHPAHVHLFRNFAKEMTKRGHNIYITARNKDITFKLLDVYQLEYITLGKHYKSLFGKAVGAFSHIVKMLFIGLKYKIDIFLDAGTMYPAIVSLLLRKPNIMVDNTDIDFTLNYVKLFTDVFITPTSFKKELGEKQIKCESFNELAFLHPKYFTPNKNILKVLKIREDEVIILLRFVLWKAVDDIGYNGYSVNEIRKLVNKFNQYGKVFISCEYDLPSDLEIYHIEKNRNLQHGQMQDLEYFSTIFFGESGAMAAECAMLGTPAIFVSPKQIGFVHELDNKYGLILDLKTKVGAMEKVIELLESDNLKKEWNKKKIKMLNEKINYTDFLVWFVNEYPSSVSVMNKNPEFQFNFK